MRELSREPVIIGGCARSGTTLLLSILSCHPKILTIEKETGAFCPGAYVTTGYNPDPDLDATFDLSLIYQYLNEIEIPPEFKRWCEKKPRNVLYIKRILNLFRENVHFIHMVRDGRDVIVSRHPSDPSVYWVDVHRWVQDVSAGYKYKDHPQVLTIRYEDLVRNYEQVVEQICEFIEVEFVGEFLEYPKSARKTRDSAWFREAQPIRSQSIGKWENPEYAGRIASLYAEPQAVKLLNSFGYMG